MKQLKVAWVIGGEAAVRNQGSEAPKFLPHPTRIVPMSDILKNDEVGWRQDDLRGVRSLVHVLRKGPEFTTGCWSLLTSAPDCTRFNFQVDAELEMSLKSATGRVFTPRKSTNVTNQSCLFTGQRVV